MLQEPRGLLFRSDGTWTLWRVLVLSILTTAAVLFGWDLIEHAYSSGTSSASMHRIHIVWGISTGVLVSVGIASLLL